MAWYPRTFAQFASTFNATVNQTSSVGTAAANHRLQNLNGWLQQVLGHDEFSVATASDDASFRRYFRVTLVSGTTLIAMDAPPERENSRPFVRIALAWRQRILPVPAISAIDLARGFLLLEDFGGQDLLSAADHEGADARYRQALDTLVTLQDKGGDDYPEYDRSLVQRELDLFPEWYVQRHLGLAWGGELAREWLVLCEHIHKRWSAMTRSAVHRDFHSRNLMVRAGKVPGWLDFQDACYGPAVYDVVSLLKDCYIELTASERDALFRHWFDLATERKLIAEPLEAVRSHFEWAGIQRHLKVLGIFCRLNYRDKKSRYLSDLPLVRRYLVEAMAPFPECQPIMALIAAAESV